MIALKIPPAGEKAYERNGAMKITFLGTGNAQATACYNTCFVMEEGGKCLLVDGGGGNLLLRRLQDAGYKWQDMRDIIVTHKHIDHLLGIIWMQRMICQNMARGKYEGEARLYAHEEVIRILRQMAEMLLTEKERKFIDERFFLIEVKDGETREIIGQTVQFFDIHSTKAKQFGFAMTLKDGRKIACCGDEPYCEAEYEYVKGSALMLHEAFCLYSQRDIFEPYKKNHSTVKDACELAEQLGVPNLVLYHTEDKSIENRKALYTKEGRQYYHGSLIVPDDLETLEL